MQHGPSSPPHIGSNRVSPDLHPISRIVVVSVASCLVVVLTTLVFIGFTIPHGFDWTDEAWLYTLVSNNRLTVGEAWGFQHLLHPAFEAMGSSVLVFRWLRLVGYLALGAGLIALSLRVASGFGIRLRPWLWVTVAAMTQIGTFLAWSYPPRYLGYNELSGWLSEAGAGLLILAIASDFGAQPSRRPRWMFVLWGVVGALFTLLCLDKFTSGVAFFLVSITVLALARGPVRRRGKFLAVVVGAFAVLGVVALFGYPVLGYLSNLRHVLFPPPGSADTTHTPSAVILLYLQSSAVTIGKCLPAIVGLLILFFSLDARTRDLPGVRASARRKFAVLLAVLLIAGGLVIWIPASKFRQIGYLTALLAAGVIAMIVYFARQPRATSTQSDARSRVGFILAGAVLVSAPFVSAFGTNNEIFGQLLYSSTIWAVAIGVGLAVVVQRLSNRGSRLTVVPVVIVLALVVVSGLQVLGDSQRPYRTAPYLSQQTVTGVTPLEGIQLTSDEADWAAWLQRTALKMHAEDVPTVALASPGALLLFNASPFANPWLTTDWPVSFASVGAACSSSPPSDLIVLQPGSEPDDSGTLASFKPQIARCGFEFPKDFTVIATRSSETPSLAMRVWRLNPGASPSSGE